MIEPYISNAGARISAGTGYNDLNDMKKKYIRILHEKSFIDDATRIWRAIRYEQRLGFQIEPNTLKLLRRDVRMLKTVGDTVSDGNWDWF